MDKVVTFGCNPKVHVFVEKCGLLPMWPYRPHSDVESAMNYLISCGVKNPQVIVHQVKTK